MNLGDFLSTAGSVPPAPVEPVSFNVLHEDQGGERRKIPVNAILVCITEKARQKCMRDALAHLRKEYPEGIPPDRLAEEERYQILAECLRDADEPRKAFSGVTQLRSAIVSSEAAEVWSTWVNFMDREFPPSISPEEFQQLVEDAKKKSLSGLLGSIDSSKILRALPGLMFLLKNSPTQTSSELEPA